MFSAHEFSSRVIHGKREIILWPVTLEGSERRRAPLRGPQDAGLGDPVQEDGGSGGRERARNPGAGRRAR